MQRLPLEKDKRRGAMLVLAALMCLALIPISGLVVDGANAYMMRLELSTAVDAAVLAGARSLNVGADLSAQSLNAQSVATAVFNANLSAMNGKLTNISFVPASPLPAAGIDIRTVSASASGDLPLIMMKMLGPKYSTVHIGLSATAQRRDVNMVLILDHSGSMKAVMKQMQADAIDFINMFAAGRDNVGLVTFSDDAFVAYPPAGSALPDWTAFQTDLPPIINGFKSQGSTNTSSAMWAAYTLLKTRPNTTGALNVIVLFTDGQANTFTADFDSLVLNSAGCSGLKSPLVGSITGGTGTVQLPYGLFDPVVTSAVEKAPTAFNRPAPNSNGCKNISNNSNLKNYLSGLPPTDVNGNSTTGPLTADLSHTINAALNAFQDAANNIRSDTTRKPVIYSIGLGGNPGAPPDNALLALVANDPSSASYNSNQSAGYFAYSPTITDLHSAFLRIASQVLRLAQ